MDTAGLRYVPDAKRNRQHAYYSNIHGIQDIAYFVDNARECVMTDYPLHRRLIHKPYWAVKGSLGSSDTALTSRLPGWTQEESTSKWQQFVKVFKRVQQ